jgi:hypothetical protein
MVGLVKNQKKGLVYYAPNDKKNYEKKEKTIRSGRRPPAEKKIAERNLKKHDEKKSANTPARNTQGRWKNAWFYSADSGLCC